MPDTRDWDDDLDPDARDAVMNRTAIAMGLTPRYGKPEPAKVGA